MRCLYQIYAQTPVVLENEPRCLDPRKPNAPCTAVTHAHASILGLNKIPWAGGSGYARQGEEVKDLGIAAGEDILESSHSESILRPLMLATYRRSHWLIPLATSASGILEPIRYPVVAQRPSPGWANFWAFL